MSVNGVKYIKVPQPVAVKNAVHAPGETVKDGGKDLVMHLRKVVIFALEHEMFSKSAELRRKSDRIADWAETLEPGKVVEVAEEWLSLLNQALDTRSVIPYFRWVVRQFGPLFNALESAKDKAEDFAPPPASNGAADPATKNSTSEVAQA